MTVREAKSLRVGPLTTQTDLQPNAVHDLTGTLNILLADVFALYLKTRIFIGTCLVRIFATIICC